MERQSNWYTFAGTTVPATGDITGKINNVWNNDGDTSYLYDSSGRLVSQKKG
jgi:YD repeat-containing protein